MAAGSLFAMTTGEHIVIAGLAIQLLFFGFFVYVAALFHYRVKNTTRVKNRLYGGASSHIHTWESMMWMLYAACLLIFIRSVYRVVEFVQGNDGYLMKKEYFLYIFDAVLMLLVCLLFNIMHPSRILSSRQPYGKMDSDQVEMLDPRM